MKYIKLFEDLTPQQIRRQTVLDYKKNKPIEIPFVKEVDEKTIRVECKDKGWYVDFYFDWVDRLCAVDNPWNIRIPDWYGLKVGFTDIKYWARRTEDLHKGVFLDAYRVLDREAQKYNL